MAMYAPLFAAVSAHYRKARKQRGDCPQILALDEAFAGVEEKNIAAMFELLRMPDFDYILNSQSLWGCYESVHSPYGNPNTLPHNCFLCGNPDSLRI